MFLDIDDDDDDDEEEEDVDEEDDDDDNDAFGGLKVIKVERSPSPIIVLPPSTLQVKRTNNSNKRLRMSRQSMQSWQLNNLRVNRKTMAGQFVIGAMTKLSGGGLRTTLSTLNSSAPAATTAASTTTPASANNSATSTSSSATSTATTTTSYRGRSVKSTGKSALLTETPRTVQTSKTVKRETLNHSDGMIYTANDDKPWSCKMCKRQYKWKNSLNCHIKNECGKPPKFFCGRMCGYKTNINSNMKRHMNSNCKPRFLQ